MFIFEQNLFSHNIWQIICIYHIWYGPWYTSNIVFHNPFLVIVLRQISSKNLHSTAIVEARLDIPSFPFHGINLEFEKYSFEKQNLTTIWSFVSIVCENPFPDPASHNWQNRRKRYKILTRKLFPSWRFLPSVEKFYVLKRFTWEFHFKKWTVNDPADNTASWFSNQCK